MANFVFNVAKGRVAELVNRVDANDPAASALVVVVINAGAATDATMKDYATLSALIGDVNVIEVTNTGYARKVLTDVDLVAAAPDQGADVMNADIPDLAWGAITAGDAWTDIVVCYDADTAAGTDANIIPLTNHDFAVTPDGSSITTTVPAAGFFQAS